MIDKVFMFQLTAAAMGEGEMTKSLAQRALDEIERLTTMIEEMRYYDSSRIISRTDFDFGSLSDDV